MIFTGKTFRILLIVLFVFLATSLFFLLLGFLNSVFSPLTARDASPWVIFSDNQPETALASTLITSHSAALSVIDYIPLVFSVCLALLLRLFYMKALIFRRVMPVHGQEKSRLLPTTSCLPSPASKLALYPRSSLYRRHPGTRFP